MIDIFDAQPKIQRLLDKNVISGKVLLDRLRFLDESARNTATYADPMYSGFYYHLGKVLDPVSMMEIGFNLGLLSSCFLKSCKTVKNFYGFQSKKESYYSPRLGTLNLKTNYKNNFDIFIGNITDFTLIHKNCELIIINEEINYDEYLLYLDLLWGCLADNGVVVSEYIRRNKVVNKAFTAFSNSKNRQIIEFKTRFGTGLIQK